MKKKYIWIIPALFIMGAYFYGLIAATLKLEETSVDSLSISVRNGMILDFGAMVEGDWNRLCIITPYTPMEQAMKTTGLNLDRLENYGMAYREDANLLVFAKEAMVRKYIYLPRQMVDVEPKKIKSGGYDREEAIFMVETKEQGAFLAHMDDLRGKDAGSNPRGSSPVYAVQPGEPEKINGSDFTVRWLEKGYYKQENGRYIFSEGLMPIEKDGKWGYMDKTGRIVIPLMYDAAGSFSEGIAPVKLEQKYGGINWWNEIVIPLNYDYMGEFSQGLALVMNKELRANQGKDKFGFMKDADKFNQPFAVDQYGFIDSKGQVMIPLIYDNAGAVSGGLVPLEKNDIWSVADITGKILYSTVFDGIGSFSKDGIAPVENEFGQGYMDRNGQLITPMEYMSTWGFSEGLALVEDASGYYFINNQGTKVLNLSIRSFGGESSFQEGRRIVMKDRKFGFIDRYGTLDIPLVYDRAMDFSEGLAGVAFTFGQEQWGYIDKNNRKLVPLIFDWIQPFSEGAALVKKDGRCGILYRPAE